MNTKLIKLTMPVILLSALAACGDGGKTNLERSYNLVDNDEKQAGVIKLHGVGGGEIVDNDGKVIGRIVPTDGSND